VDQAQYSATLVFRTLTTLEMQPTSHPKFILPHLRRASRFDTLRALATPNTSPLAFPPSPDAAAASAYCSIYQSRRDDKSSNIDLFVPTSGCVSTPLAIEQRRCLCDPCQVCPKSCVTHASSSQSNMGESGTNHNLRYPEHITVKARPQVTDL
jgi:hypothetical protein